LAVSFVAPSSAVTNTTDGDLGAGIGVRFSSSSLYDQVGIGGSV